MNMLIHKSYCKWITRKDLIVREGNVSIVLMFGSTDISYEQFETLKLSSLEEII
uniref:Uncharacterized protein n=1 Tax=Meloidogyne enterolobii TaxID=390850 RepID=A0A6V7X0Y7_MELEN|nr:unnamed protein product [Meloidogyne enterolobii]CAD2192981.1 unnamed protein product [Meloidogyne enterolobii]CAD2204616.1 unnamed protein product [Meloidogyne enterolobii]